MMMIRCTEGRNDKERVAVTSDALDIVRRLKEIDPDYFVMLNRTTQRFEVHIRGESCTLGCELPFDALDARAIEYVREHHSSRIADIIRAIDEAHARREAEAERRLQEAHRRFEDGVKYLYNKRTMDEFPDEAAEGMGDEP